MECNFPNDHMLPILKTTLLNMTYVHVTNNITAERQHRALLAVALAAHCMYTLHVHIHHTIGLIPPDLPEILNT